MALVGEAKRRLVSAVLIGCTLVLTLASMDGCSRDHKAPEAAAPSAPQNTAATTPAAEATPIPPSPSAALGPAPGAATAEQLRELTSPIALYPDVLVAQILAASTYPTQVVEAFRWAEQNPNLHGDQLAAAVNPQPWDPSVKSLTQFPPVLKTMNDNLAWTSALGEAYFNQPADVMNAIQALRKMATDAGTLKTTPQQTVEVQTAPSPEGSGGPQQTIVIQPAQPNVVYVPQYNPQAAYGAPVAQPPGYSGAQMAVTGLLSFGLGMAMGALINGGNNDWRSDWRGGSVHYNNNVYVSRTNVVPARYPTGYPAAGYPAGYPRQVPANPYARPLPYAAARPPYNGAVPATRPYNPANAKQYAANNPSLTKPAFPNPATLQSNPAVSNLRTKKAAPNQPQTPANRSSVNAASNRPAANPKANSLSGYGKPGNAAAGGRTSVLGGVEPGGSAQAASGRGRASFQANQSNPRPAARPKAQEASKKGGGGTGGSPRRRNQ